MAKRQPTAPAWQFGGSYLCHCPYCGNFHWHGAADGLPTDRLSHCLSDARSYRLVEATAEPPDAEEIGRASRRAARRVRP